MWNKTQKCGTSHKYLEQNTNMYYKQGLTGDKISPEPGNIQKRYAGAGINRDFGSLPWPGPGLGDFSRGRFFSLNILQKSVNKFK